MNAPSFAIAASSFSRPSETFIRDHAHTILPGKTVLLCHEAPPVEFDQVPSLSGIDMGAWPREANRIRQVSASMRRYWRRYLYPFLPDKAQQRIVEFLKQYGVTAILAEYGPTGVMLSGPAKAAGVSLYVHFHGFDAAVMSRLPLWGGRYRRLFATAAGVIGPSKFIAEKLIAMGCPANKSHVCACGIDPLRFTPSMRSTSRLVAVGRLVAKKAPTITIGAFAKIADQFPDARLDIIGDGPLMGRCQAQINELGMADRVTLHGRQSHEFVSGLMGQASGFLQHSVSAPSGDVEGMPVSILEAMACALPIVSTRHSGIQEAVQHDVTGLLVAERDVNAMADAIADLLSDPERAAAMGTAGRVRVLANYTQEKSSDTLRSIMGL